MSVYQQLRFKEVSLNLLDRPDIVSWLEYVVAIKKDHTITEVYPNDMTEGSRCETLSNEFEDDLMYTIDISDLSNVKLDICIGNKNKNDDMEELVFLLKQYIIDGEIFYYDECTTREVDVDKMTEKCFEFFKLEETYKKFKVLENRPARYGPIDWDEDLLADKLHEGL